MPLSGVHIVLLYVSGRAEAALSRKAVWSQTMTSAGVTTLAAPITTSGQSPNYGPPCFEISCSLEIYVAIGPSPDASQVFGSGNTARIRVPANEIRDIYCDEGDKLAWVAA